MESALYSSLANFKLGEVEGQHAKLVELCRSYEGTKNYHNFTRKMSYKDASANRYIMEMKVSETFKIKEQ